MEGRRENICACVDLSKSLASLLGPRSLEKMIIDFDGTYIVTNDGATAAARMQTMNPAARLLVEMSQTMDKQYGDGTTSVIILASSMLACAQSALDSGLHSSQVIMQFSSVAPVIKDWIREYAIVYKSESDVDEISKQVCKTTLSSKLASQFVPGFVSLAVDFAKSFVDPEGGQKGVSATSRMQTIEYILNNREKLPIILVSGDSPDSSQLVDGFVFSDPRIDFHFFSKQEKERNAPPRISCSSLLYISSPKIVVLKFPLDKSVYNKFAGVVASNLSLDRMIREEEAWIKSRVLSIKKLGIHLVIMAYDVSKANKALYLPEYAKELFKKVGISVLMYPLVDYNENLQRHILVPEFHEPADLEKPRTDVPLLFDYFACFQLQEKTLFNFKKLASSSKSVILRAPSETILEEIKRSLIDAVCVCARIMTEKSVIPGGGAIESLIALKLRSEFPDSVLHNLMANAFLEIPMTLARNGGMNPQSTVSELLYRLSQRVALSDEPFTSKSLLGLDVVSKRVVNVFESGVLECFGNKIGQVSMAIECALSVLRIERVVCLDDFVC